MDAKITFWDALPLFITMLLITIGMFSYMLRLKEILNLKLFLAGIIIISFFTFQFLVYTYILKFDIYYGLNAALLIIILTAIIFSPFFFKVINFVKNVSAAKTRVIVNTRENFDIKEISETTTDVPEFSEINETYISVEELLNTTEKTEPKPVVHTKESPEVSENKTIDLSIKTDEKDEDKAEEPHKKPAVKKVPLKKAPRKQSPATNPKTRQSRSNRKTRGKK